MRGEEAEMTSDNISARRGGGSCENEEAQEEKAKWLNFMSRVAKRSIVFNERKRGRGSVAGPALAACASSSGGGG